MKAILAFLFSNWKEWDYEECIRFFGCKVFQPLYRTTPDCMPHLLDEKNVRMPELKSRWDGLLKKLARLEEQIAVKTDELEETAMRLTGAEDVETESNMIRDAVLGKMGELRIACDEAETMTAKKYWPFPTYGDLLFGVK